MMPKEWVHGHARHQRGHVPERFVGSTLRVKLGVFGVEIFSDDMLIASHSRRFGESGSSLSLEHYLDQLRRKPGALWDCEAVQQHSFSPELLEIFERLKKRHTERRANKRFIEILYLGRRHGSKNLLSVTREALQLGIVEPEAIEGLIYSYFSALPIDDEHFLQNRFQHRKSDNWKCDVAQYSQLTGGLGA